MTCGGEKLTKTNQTVYTEIKNTMDGGKLNKCLFLVIYFLDKCIHNSLYQAHVLIENYSILTLTLCLYYINITMCLASVYFRFNGINGDK